MTEPVTISFLAIYYYHLTLFAHYLLIKCVPGALAPWSSLLCCLVICQGNDNEKCAMLSWCAEWLRRELWGFSCWCVKLCKPFFFFSHFCPGRHGKQKLVETLCLKAWNRAERGRLRGGRGWKEGEWQWGISWGNFNNVHSSWYLCVCAHLWEE